MEIGIWIEESHNSIHYNFFSTFYTSLSLRQIADIRTSSSVPAPYKNYTEQKIQYWEPKL